MQNISTRVAGSPRIELLRLKRGIKCNDCRNAVLSRPHIDLSHHAHLEVLWRRDGSARVGASIGRKIVISMFRGW